MSNISAAQTASREKTLLIALLLSMWAPLATGLAVIMSSSATQLADFIRRSAELIALFISWWVFRYLARNKKMDGEKRAGMEIIASISVSVALLCSGLVMLILTFMRTSDFQPGGNVYPGLLIASLGLITNSWFWRRYTLLNREFYSSIIDAQRQLYRAKAFVDLSVIIALIFVALAPALALTRIVDLIGSLVLSVYLVWSGVQAGRKALLIGDTYGIKRLKGEQERHSGGC